MSIAACSKQCIQPSDFGEQSQYDSFLLHAKDTTECAFEKSNQLNELSDKMQSCMHGKYFNTEDMLYTSETNETKKVSNLIKDGFIPAVTMNNFNKITAVDGIASANVYCNSFDYASLSSTSKETLETKYKFQDAADHGNNLLMIKEIYNACGAYCSIECSGLDFSADPSSLGTQPEWKKNNEKSNTSYFGITITEESNVKVQATGKISLNDEEESPVKTNIEIRLKTPFVVPANLILKGGMNSNILYKLDNKNVIPDGDSASVLKHYIMELKNVSGDLLDVSCSLSGQISSNTSMFQDYINNNILATQNAFYSALKCLKNSDKLYLCDLLYDHVKLFMDNSCLRSDNTSKIESMDNINSVVNTEASIFNYNSPIFNYTKLITSKISDNKNLFFDNLVVSKVNNKIKYTIGENSAENSFFATNASELSYKIEKVNKNSEMNLLIQSSENTKNTIVGYLFNEIANSTKEFTIDNIMQPVKLLFKNYETNRTKNCTYLIKHTSSIYDLVNDKTASKTYKLTLEPSFGGWKILKNEESGNNNQNVITTDLVINEFSNVAFYKTTSDTLTISLADKTANPNCMTGLAIQVIPLKDIEIQNSGFLYFYNINQDLDTSQQSINSNADFSIINPNFQAFRKILIESITNPKQNDLSTEILNNYYEYYFVMENNKGDKRNIKKHILNKDGLYNLEFRDNSPMINDNLGIYNQGIFVRKGQVIRYDYTNFMKIDSSGDIEILYKKLKGSEATIVNANYDLINIIKKKPAYLCSSLLEDETVSFSSLCSSAKKIYFKNEDGTACKGFKTADEEIAKQTALIGSGTLDEIEQLKKAIEEAVKEGRDSDAQSNSIALETKQESIQGYQQEIQRQESIKLELSNSAIIRDNVCYKIENICEENLPEECSVTNLAIFSIEKDSVVSTCTGKNEGDVEIKNSYHTYNLKYTTEELSTNLFSYLETLQTYLNNLSATIKSNNITKDNNDVEFTPVCLEEFQKNVFKKVFAVSTIESNNDLYKIINNFTTKMNLCLSKLQNKDVINSKAYMVDLIKPSIMNMNVGATQDKKTDQPKMHIVSLINNQHVQDKFKNLTADFTLDSTKTLDITNASTEADRIAVKYKELFNQFFVSYKEDSKASDLGILDSLPTLPNGQKIEIDKEQLDEAKEGKDSSSTIVKNEFKYLFSRSLGTCKGDICTTKVKQCFDFNTGFSADLDSTNLLSTSDKYFGSFFRFKELGDKHLLSLFKVNNKIPAFSNSKAIGNLSSFTYFNTSNLTEEQETNIKSALADLKIDLFNGSDPIDSDFLYNTGITSVEDVYIQMSYIQEEGFYKKLANNTLTADLGTATIDNLLKDKLGTLNIKLNKVKEYDSNGKYIALFLGFRENVYKLNSEGILESSYGNESSKKTEDLSSYPTMPKLSEKDNNYIVWLTRPENLLQVTRKDQLDKGKFKFDDKGNLVNVSSNTPGLNFKDTINKDIITLVQYAKSQDRKLALFFRIIDKNTEPKDNTGSYNITIRNTEADNGLLNVSWFTRRQYDSQLIFDKIIPDPVSIFNMLINIVLEIMDGKPYGVPKDYTNYRCDTKSAEDLKNTNNICFIHNSPNIFSNGQICNKDHPEAEYCFDSCDVLVNGGVGNLRANCLIVYNNGGILKSLYKNIIQDSLYQFIIKLALITMITLYGFGYFLGLSEFKQSEFMSRIIKVSFIYALISDSGWEIYDTFVISFFKQGIDSLMFIIASSFEIGSNTYIQDSVNAGNYSNKMVIFASGFENLKLLFSDALLYKMLGLAFSGWYGLIYCYLVFTSFVSYVTTFINAIILFLTAQIFTSVTLAIGPLMFILLFYERTKSSFDGWLGILIGYALQQIFIVVTLSVFNTLINDAIRTTFRYSVCMLPLFSISILGFPLSIFHFWKVPGTSFSGSISNPQSQGIPSFYSIMNFYILIGLMSKFLSKMADLGSSFGGGISVTSFADPLTKAVSAAGEKVNSFAKSVASSPITRANSWANDSSKGLADKMEKQRVERNALLKNADKAGKEGVNNALADSNSSLSTKKREVDTAKMNYKKNGTAENKKQLKLAELDYKREETNVRKTAKRDNLRQTIGEDKMIEQGFSLDANPKETEEYNQKVKNIENDAIQDSAITDSSLNQRSKRIDKLDNKKRTHFNVTRSTEAAVNMARTEKGQTALKEKGFSKDQIDTFTAHRAGLGVNSASRDALKQWANSDNTVRDQNRAENKAIDDAKAAETGANPAEQIAPPADPVAPPVGTAPDRPTTPNSVI